MLTTLRRLIGRRWPDGKLLLAFLAAAAFVLFFATFASEVMEGDALAIDRHVLAALRSPAGPTVPIGPRWLVTAMRDVTSLGSTTCLTILTLIVAGFLLMARNAGMAVFLAVSTAGGAVVGSLLKLAFNRPRPDLSFHLVDVGTSSFPSGHALNSAVIYLTLGALLARTQAEVRIRVYVLAVAMLLTLTIGFSRIYLGVHWASDVLAGWVIGAAWATLCSLLATYLQKRRQLEPAAPEG